MDATLQTATPPKDIADPPGALHRWLGAVPMFMTFAVIAIGLTRVSWIFDIFRNLRVDLPLPSHLLYGIYKVATPYYGAWPPIMLTVAMAYFGWACKRRSRMMWVSLISLSVFLMVLWLVLGGALLPMIKIQIALGKK
jgi:hypothetical protein